MSNGNGEMPGSLHCATDDKTVRRFGRDDAVSVTEPLKDALDVAADHASFFEVALVVLFGLPEGGVWDDLGGDLQAVGA